MKCIPYNYYDGRTLSVSLISLRSGLYMYWGMRPAQEELVTSHVSIPWLDTITNLWRNNEKWIASKRETWSIQIRVCLLTWTWCLTFLFSHRYARKHESPPPLPSNPIPSLRDSSVRGNNWFKPYWPFWQFLALKQTCRWKMIAILSTFFHRILNCWRYPRLATFKIQSRSFLL